MSLETRLQALIGAIGGDIKALFVRAVPVDGAVGQVLVKTGPATGATGWTTQTKITVSTTAPASPSVGDVWVDIS